jgi:carboxylesterase type B
MNTRIRATWQRRHAAVLEWVRDNVSNFGGDPGNVIIFASPAEAEKQWR